MTTPNNQKLLSELLEKSKKDKKSLIMLKHLAVSCQCYELAAEIRGIEVELFPESKQIKQEKHFAGNLNLLFNMVGFEISKKGCWILFETMKTHAKKKQNFSIEDAAKIKAKAEQIFDPEE